jgi:COX assembly mitochondrial protein 1
MARGIIPELPTSNSSQPPTPSLRNPLPLSAAQEAQVRDLYYKKVRSQCATEIKEFAACARNRTFSLSWACKAEQFAMNSCMIAHATRQAEDAAREEWFEGVQERRIEREKEKVAVEQRRTEVIDMTRRQEEKERIEAEAKKVALEERGGKKGWWQ